MSIVLITKSHLFFRLVFLYENPIYSLSIVIASLVSSKKKVTDSTKSPISFPKLPAFHTIAPHNVPGSQNRGFI